MSFLSPYKPRPPGMKPDLRRTLRREPVRRDEVRICRRLDGDSKPQWLVTMPSGTYRLETRGKYHSRYFVGDPALWQPLLDQLAAQYSPLNLEIFISNGFDYHCEQCGARFLAHRLAGNMVRLCSDKCERVRRNAKLRQWRAMTTPDHLGRHRRAPVQQRAEARAGRTCEHCGVAIEVTRSDRRFCSDRCRVRAYHRRRHRQAARPKLPRPSRNFSAGEGQV
jgi:predicted nucleic acid-binding Zn ribbon protein